MITRLLTCVLLLTLVISCATRSSSVDSPDEFWDRSSLSGPEEGKERLIIHLNDRMYIPGLDAKDVFDAVRRFLYPEENLTDQELIQAIKAIPLTTFDGTVIRVGDVAEVRLGTQNNPTSD